MAGRFPGAPDVDDALAARRAPARTASSTSPRASCWPPGCRRSVLDDPDYVRRNGVLDDLEMFDAGFFGIGPRDAAIMDPQHRHFLECAWEALETSGTCRSGSPARSACSPAAA